MNVYFLNRIPEDIVKTPRVSCQEVINMLEKLEIFSLVKRRTIDGKSRLSIISAPGKAMGNFILPVATAK